MLRRVYTVLCEQAIVCAYLLALFVHKTSCECTQLKQLTAQQCTQVPIGILHTRTQLVLTLSLPLFLTNTHTHTHTHTHTEQVLVQASLEITRHAHQSQSSHLEGHLRHVTYSPAKALDTARVTAIHGKDKHYHEMR